MLPSSQSAVKDMVASLCSLEHVRPTTDFGRDTISRFLLDQSDTTSHGNHWIYYLTACRRLWLSFFDGETFIPITTRFNGKPPFVIVRPVGVDVAKKCAILAEQIVALSRNQLIVKNISAVVRDELSTLGFSDYLLNDGWSPAYRYDDQTYPEVVIDLDGLAALQGNAYAHLRHDLHRGLINRLVLDRYCPAQHGAEVLGLIAKWEQSFLERYPQENVPDLAEFYTTFVRRHEGLEFGRDYYGWVFQVDRRIMGFAYGAPKPGKSVDMYANPCFYEENCASEAVLFSALCEIRKLGCKFANLGGSETAGLHRFKKKFAPTFEIARFHMVLNKRD